MLDCFLLLNKIALSLGRPQIGFLGNELPISAILFGDTRVLDVIVLTESNKKKGENTFMAHKTRQFEALI